MNILTRKLPKWLALALTLFGSTEATSLRAGNAPPAPKVVETAGGNHEWQLPNERVMLPFKLQQPITFVNRTEQAAEWDKLPAFWNVTTETAPEPRTGKVVVRKIVKIKVPLGLTQSPPVPAENPLTVARWLLGKRLFFDPVLSSNNTVSCASCHDPRHAYTDAARVSSGINGLKGSVSAPSVLNAAFNKFQFWDGRASSLEEQAQGPVQNPVEMFDGHGNAWQQAVARVRRKGDYRQRFLEAFGTEPTRDAIAKAIACYERTVLSGNAIHDRADRAMQVRVTEEESTKYVIEPKDYEKVLKEAFRRKDPSALRALDLEPLKDLGKVPAVARQLSNGRTLFFGKARCSTCHAGDTFTDHQFHNLGVGVKDGQILPGNEGRFARLPTGHKNPVLLGAFKTPSLRGLLHSAPYMHDGSETTLEKVVEFYDRGGNANEFLDGTMRDAEAEKAYDLARESKKPYKGPAVQVFGKEQKPVVPLRLNLTPQEKKDLVLFLKALQGDPIDSIVADKDRMPPDRVGKAPADFRRTGD